MLAHWLAHSITIPSTNVPLERLGTMFYHPWCAAAHTCHSWASLAKVPPWAFPLCHFHTVLWSLGSSSIFQIFPLARTVVFSSVSLLFSKILSSLQKPRVSTISFLWVMFSGFPILSSAYAETVNNQTISCCFCLMCLFSLSGGFRTMTMQFNCCKICNQLVTLMLASGTLVFESSGGQFGIFNLLHNTPAHAQLSVGYSHTQSSTS